MSMRSEIRAQLVSGPKSTDELLPLVPAAEGDRVRLSANMSTLARSGMVRRVGLSDEGKPLYQLEPKLWPAKEEPDLSDVIATLPPSLKKSAKDSAAKEASPPKAQRPAADPARKAAKQPAAKTHARQPAAALSAKSAGKRDANARAVIGGAVVLASPRAESIFVGLMATGEIRVQVGYECDSKGVGFFSAPVEIRDRGMLEDAIHDTMARIREHCEWKHLANEVKGWPLPKTFRNVGVRAIVPGSAAAEGKT